MTITIELTPEEMAAVEVKARKHGMELPAFAKLRILEEGEDYGPLFPDFGTPEEEEASESAWQASFARSGDLLRRMAAESDEDHRRGGTEPLDVLLEKQR